MSKTVEISTGSGTRAVFTGDQGVISFQRFDANGLAVGGPTVIAQSHGLDGKFFGVGVDSGGFAVAALSDGGFEVVFNESSGDPQGFVRQQMVGVEVDATGGLVTNPAINADNGLTAGNLRVMLDTPAGKISGATPTDPHIYALGGGRYAVAYDTFDSHNVATSHVAFGNAAGLYSDTVVSSRPDNISGGAGDVTLAWAPDPADPSHRVFHEQLGDDGTVLAGRHAVDLTILSTRGFTATPGYDPAHAEILVTNPDVPFPDASATTLTFDARDHTLTWDQDSGGPMAPVVLTSLDVASVSQTNLAFLPGVLKNIALDGSSTIQWFDTTGAQPWETLIATETASGAVKTYTSILHDGTRTEFVFDADNTQPYTRYVDQTDAAGHVLTRTVLVDTGNSWEAKYTYAGGQVVSYEVDSFDQAGLLVGKAFFNPDGSVLAH